MDFAQTYDTVALGQVVTVSNGMPAPTNQDGVPYRLWRSHNFTGELVQKINAPRALCFRLPETGGVTVSYTVAEGIGHTFTV